MSSSTSFMDACLAGEALLDDIDDWVDTWHEHSGAPRGQRESLEAYLGFDDFEYSLWAERPSLLRVIVSARKQRKSVDDVRSAAQTALAAARTSNDIDAPALLDWLRKTRRISDDDFGENR